MKMDRTFSYRRQEIITEMPFIAQLQNRWPALFTPSEVNAEFTRITTKPLVSTFMFQLDHYTDPLLKTFRKKGGTAGLKITGILAAMGKNPSVEKRRECILKALCVYLNENPDNLIKESLQTMNNQLDMVVYVIQHEGAEPTDDPGEVNIIIEGVEVLQDVKDVANGCALLLGLIYCLNLEFPTNLKYTFEFIQKVLMDMDGQKLSRKVEVLKGKLYE
ncbi:uncharacterized protein ACNS7B_003505 [Menidia menidia]